MFEFIKKRFGFATQKKLDNGNTQITEYYFPRRWRDFFRGGKISRIYTLDKNGNQDGDDSFFENDGKTLLRKLTYQNGLYVGLEGYENQRIRYRETVEERTPSFDVVMCVYYRPDGTIESKHFFEIRPSRDKSGRKLYVPNGQWINYDDGDRGVQWVSFLGDHEFIRNRRELTHFLDTTCKKEDKKRLVRAYRAVFPQTNKEKSERNIERIARRKLRRINATPDCRVHS